MVSPPDARSPCLQLSIASEPLKTWIKLVLLLCVILSWLGHGWDNYGAYTVGSQWHHQAPPEPVPQRIDGTGLDL